MPSWTKSKPDNLAPWMRCTHRLHGLHPRQDAVQVRGPAQALCLAYLRQPGRYERGDGPVNVEDIRRKIA